MEASARLEAMRSSFNKELLLLDTVIPRAVATAYQSPELWLAARGTCCFFEHIAKQIPWSATQTGRGSVLHRGAPRDDSATRGTLPRKNAISSKSRNGVVHESGSM